MCIRRRRIGTYTQSIVSRNMYMPYLIVLRNSTVNSKNWWLKSENDILNTFTICPILSEFESLNLEHGGYTFPVALQGPARDGSGVCYIEHTSNALAAYWSYSHTCHHLRGKPLGTSSHTYGSVARLHLPLNNFKNVRINTSQIEWQSIKKKKRSKNWAV